MVQQCHETSDLSRKPCSNLRSILLASSPGILCSEPFATAQSIIFSQLIKRVLQFPGGIEVESNLSPVIRLVTMKTIHKKAP